MTYIASNIAIESLNNNSTTLLTNSSTFTGTWETSNLPDLMITIKTDQNGVLYVDFSPDGTNVDSTLSFNYNTARINPPHILVKGARYFRVRFTNNSGSDQTYLRLKTDLGHFQKLTASVNGTLSETYDAIVVRPTSFENEVAMNKRQGVTLWNKFGYNLNVNSTSAEVIASFGGTFSRMTSAGTLNVVSSSTADANPSGTGVRQIVIVGIDENRLAQQEVVNMNGTSVVTTSEQWLGVNRVAGYSHGSGEVNEGTITITATSGGSTQAQMPAGDGVTQQCIFHVQANHTFLTNWLWINIRKLSGGSAPRVTVTGWVYSPVSGGKYKIFTGNFDTAIKNVWELSPKFPFPITEKSVMWFEADTNTNDTAVALRFSGAEHRID